MTGIRPIIESAIAASIAERPKYFTDRGIEKAQDFLTRKIMGALVPRDGGDKPAELPPEPTTPVPITVDPKSREGRAYTNLRALGGAVPPLRLGDGRISIPPPAQRESVYALADLPPQAEWKFVTEHRQIGAWLEFFSDTLTPAPRRKIEVERNGAHGLLMPWPWPPSKDGKIYTGEAAE